jgi:hypothetical protein
MSTTWARALFVLGLVGCGGFPDPNPERPEVPAENDPAFDIMQGGGWYLIGNAATPNQDTVAIEIFAPYPETEFIDAWVADRPVTRLTQKHANVFVGEVDITGLPLGEYDVLYAANGSGTAFARLPIIRSVPYYVLVTTDWDFSDPGDVVMDYHTSLHEEHPGLRITHFVGPYTFTDPMVPVARQQELVAKLVKMRDENTDEIGLHIHPYCHFVESAGLTCITDVSTTMPTDPSGYTINCTAYDRAQFGTLLSHAKDLFVQNGLNVPKTFRAGGWTAGISTLGALADQGFTADTSALNWARIEEWNGKELFRWNMENWAPIGDTSQPYFPSETDPLSSTSPTMSILEVPDNGVMIDYVSLEEMTGIFDANWNGAPLTTPSVLMMGFHPSMGMPKAERERVDEFLDYADTHHSTTHRGPVVYITLDDLVAVYR